MIAITSRNRHGDSVQAFGSQGWPAYERCLGDFQLPRTGMTRIERNILSPLIPRLRNSHPAAWSTLKEQTQFGPEFFDFPYYPAALEFEAMAIALVAGLEVAAKERLLAEWRRRPRV